MNALQASNTMKCYQNGSKLYLFAKEIKDSSNAVIARTCPLFRTQCVSLLYRILLPTIVFVIAYSYKQPIFNFNCSHALFSSWKNYCSAEDAVPLTCAARTRDILNRISKTTRFYKIIRIVFEMPNEVFLPLEIEQTLLLGERIIFAISSLLNVAAVFCLLTETPAHQAAIRSYLLFIQATVIATDIYFCVLFEPFPVLQVFAGYCVGLLCRVFQPTLVVGLYSTMIGAMTASIFLATIHRHQMVIMRGRWIISKRFRFILPWIVHLSYAVPCLIFSFYPFKHAESDRLINQTLPDVRWTQDRGGYFMLKRGLLPFTLISSALVLIDLAIIGFVAIFIHMFLTLHRETSKSAKLKHYIKISLVRLFIQIGVPILFILIPMMALLTEILFDCFTFDFCLFVTCIIPFHPIMHNLILLLIVPEYRARVTNILTCMYERKEMNTVTRRVYINYKKGQLYK